MHDSEPLIPSYHTTTKRRKNLIIQVRFGSFACITVGLPFGAFIFCVYWSTVYNFRESTATHCQVDNYLPSVSAAIGNFSPQKNVWMLCIILHFLPRLYIARLYFLYLKNVLEPGCFKMARSTWLFNVVEVSCLLGLTLISSTDFYPAHAFFFITFILTSMVYMLLSCYLLKKHRLIPGNNVETRSLQLKLLMTFINLAGFFFAGYCFVRHNTYCEEGVYSLFAAFEYVVVISNMAFHMTAYLDFYEKTVSISAYGITFS